VPFDVLYRFWVLTTRFFKGWFWLLIKFKIYKTFVKRDLKLFVKIQTTAPPFGSVLTANFCESTNLIILQTYWDWCTGAVFLFMPNYIGIIYFNTVAGGKHLYNLMQVVSEEMKQFFVFNISCGNKKKFLRNIFNIVRVEKIRVFVTTILPSRIEISLIWLSLVLSLSDKSSVWIVSKPLLFNIQAIP
jgi:hypothetical protein